MAAHVDERPHFSVVATHQQHGCAHHVERFVAVGFAQLATEPQHQRYAAEDAIHLELPTIGVEVVARWDSLHVGIERHRALFAVADIASCSLNQFFAAHQTLRTRPLVAGKPQRSALLPSAYDDALV